jgi:hypothetical protein
MKYLHKILSLIIISLASSAVIFEIKETKYDIGDLVIKAEQRPQNLFIEVKKTGKTQIVSFPDNLKENLKKDNCLALVEGNDKIYKIDIRYGSKSCPKNEGYGTVRYINQKLYSLVGIIAALNNLVTG